MKIVEFRVPDCLPMRLARSLLAQAAILAVLCGSALAAAKCPIDYGPHADAKPNKLFLLFPTQEITDPSLFPKHGFNPDTKWLPLRFRTSDLPKYHGTSAALRDAVADVVRDIYCEFNVHIAPITRSDATSASPAERRNTVGIGSDAFLHNGCSDVTFGQAAKAGGDPGDSDPRDYARIWAGSYNCANIPLSLEGWANSIGGSAAHEAGHNYGLPHADGDEPTRADEDDWPNHLMRGGPPNPYGYKERARPRHFSDFETSLLARQIGLAIETMWTWEFTNPNDETATALRMELLSPRQELILSWVFAESTTPWVKPVLSGPFGRRMFKGAQYHIYRLEWSAGQPWSEPITGRAHPSGEVSGGTRFQIGATFSSLTRASDPAPVIISDVTLTDARGGALAEHPPWMGFDAGTFDDDTGNLNVRFFNFSGRPLILRDVVIEDLPRVLSIKAMMRDKMMRDKPLTDVFELEFSAWEIRRPAFQYTSNRNLIRDVATPPASRRERPLFHYLIEPGEELKVPVANRDQARHISVQRSDEYCAGHGAHDLYCHSGITVDDLFPATTMYLTATVLDPSTATAATPAVENRLFYQLAGRRARLPGRRAE